jgi:hypothetical protein
MGAPNTSGVLRTRLQDMKIGDYIPCWVAAYSAYLNFYGLGQAESFSPDLCTGGVVIGTLTAGNGLISLADNTTTTYAQTDASGYTANTYFGYDFVTPKKVRCMRVAWATPVSGWNTATQSFVMALQYSDNGTDYTTVRNCTMIIEDSMLEFCIDDVGAHRYWRLMAVSGDFGKPMRVQEVAMYDYGSAYNQEVPFDLNNLGLAGMSNKMFYFIKVDKGLCIADRVVNNSASFNTNLVNLQIHGKPLYNSAINPMSNAYTPWGVVRGTFVNGYIAFDGMTTGSSPSWGTQNLVPWLSYEHDFLAKKGIQWYALRVPESNYAAMPTKYNFYGVTQDGVEELLDSQTTAATVKGMRPYDIWYFKLPKVCYYPKYKIVVTQFNTTVYNYPVNQGLIDELLLFESDPRSTKLRAPTGGSIYADKMGNMSYTDDGCGNYPTANEWDKYIVNSTLNGTCTPADDSVWHWRNGVLTMVREVPSAYMKNPYTGGAGTDSLATGRGHRYTYAEIITRSYPISRDDITYVGFRPVLEFKEDGSPY